jgi:hypothetical protein
MALFPGSLHAAGLDQPLASRLRRGHPQSQVRGGRLLLMKLKLFVNVSLTPTPKQILTKKKPQSTEPFMNHDDASGIRPSTSATAADSRSQSFNSVSNCFFPARVRM